MSNNKLHLLQIFLVIIGALNWGLYAFNYNLVTILSNFINYLIKSNYPIDKIIYILVALAGLNLARCKYTWLPFLGKTVFPKGLLNNKLPEQFDRTITIKTIPNSTIVYWSSINKNNPDEEVNKAYDNLSNGGIITSDSNGHATLKILEGNSYIVPSGRKIPRHYHYRVFDNNSILGPVHTEFY